MAKERLFSVTLKDCEVQKFRAGGKGGQNQNKRETGVRVIHHPSGARGEARDSRSQHQNERNAFLRMVATSKFKAWTLKAAALHGRNIEQEVRDDMKPGKLRIEGFDGEEWQPIP